MQLACIEFARNILGMADANSTEFDKLSKHQIIHLMEAQKGIAELGGTMRLGAYPCDVRPGTRAGQAYDSEKISERHRHRYEFNNVFRTQFVEGGAVFSGNSPDGNLVEIIEIANHPWFVACQFHPELNSRPMEPHPLFREFVDAAYLGKKARVGAATKNV